MLGWVMEELRVLLHGFLCSLIVRWDFAYRNSDKRMILDAGNLC